MPTAKNDQPPPPPDSLDHFQCYRAHGPSLTNAFKTHGTIKTPIEHPDDHLVCYAFAPTTFTTGITTRNQFGGGDLALVGADILCVPSQKLRFSVIF